MQSLVGRPWRPWFRWLLGSAALLWLIGVGLVTYAWMSDRRLIDAKLGGEERPVPRVFGRPFAVHAGDSVSESQLVERLNDVGYAQRPKAAVPGEFSVAGPAVLVVPRGAAGAAPHTVRLDFSKPSGSTVSKLAIVGGGPLDEFALEAPLLAALAPGERRRYVPLANIPHVMMDAVIAIEDHRFYEHPGVDPIGALGALWTNLRGTSRTWSAAAPSRSRSSRTRS